MSLKIGSISLDVPFFQASLSGYSDLAMRELACRFGAPLTFNGVMIDTLAMHPSVIKKHGFTPANDRHPVGAQLVGILAIQQATLLQTIAGLAG